MNHPECIITGCALVVDNEGKWLWGDLHMLGNTLIFNGAWNFALGTGASYGDPPDGDRAVHIDSNACFERRGVIVFHRDDCELNQAASDYMLAAMTGSTP